MPTLEQLPAESRAIVELLLQQDRSYDEIADTLAMPAARVRERAREALVELAPASARRVDDEWRDQIADYVLRQQSGPEGTATRAHLRRSEGARTWVASLLDSLDDLYGDGPRPELPGAEPAKPERPSRRVKRAERAAVPAGAGAAGAAGDGDAKAGGATAVQEPPSAAAKPAGGAAAAGAASAVTPGAERVVLRRRILAGAGAAAALALLVLAIVLLVGGGDEGGDDGAKAKGKQRTSVVGQTNLEPVGGGRASGTAAVIRRGNDTRLLIQASGLQPSTRRDAYEVWLFNSPEEAVSIGGAFANERGDLQGLGPLPRDAGRYRFIEVTREPLDRNARHSGNAVLRAPVEELLRGGAGGGGAGGAGGTAPQP
jgi:hypothetical protein